MGSATVRPGATSTTCGWSAKAALSSANRSGCSAKLAATRSWLLEPPGTQPVTVTGSGDGDTASRSSSAMRLYRQISSSVDGRGRARNRSKAAWRSSCSHNGPGRAAAASGEKVLTGRTSGSCSALAPEDALEEALLGLLGLHLGQHARTDGVQDVLGLVEDGRGRAVVEARQLVGRFGTLGQGRRTPSRRRTADARRPGTGRGIATGPRAPGRGCTSARSRRCGRYGSRS